MLWKGELGCYSWETNGDKSVAQTAQEVDTCENCDNDNNAPLFQPPIF
jgi:hypothetical protein